MCSFAQLKIPQNSFFISPGLLCHLIRGNTGRLANKDFT